LELPITGRKKQYISAMMPWLISAKSVSAVRQNQKNDKNDAFDIVQAALLPDITFISGIINCTAETTVDHAITGALC